MILFIPKTQKLFLGLAELAVQQQTQQELVFTQNLKATKLIVLQQATLIMIQTMNAL